MHSCLKRICSLDTKYIQRVRGSYAITALYKSTYLLNCRPLGYTAGFTDCSERKLVNK